MGQLHFLRLFADHDEEHAAEQDAGGDQHVAVGEPLLHNEGKNGDQSGEGKAEKGALQDHAAAEPQVDKFAGRGRLRSLRDKAR